jgi:hypothetical protein
VNKELREIYRSGAQQHQREFGSYTLINTKFGIGNNKNPEEFRESMAKRDIPVDEEMIDYQQELLDQFLELIQRLSDAAVDETIIIRPHPSEDFEVYRSEFEDDARVHVRHEGDVRSWIFGSTAVIHNSCTTGIESAMLEVPVFSYRPIQDEEYDSTLPNAVSTTVESKEKLVKILQNRSFDSQYEMNPQQRETLKRFFHNLDTQSTDEICSLINTIDTRADGSFDEFSSGRKRLERLIKRLPLASQFEEQFSQNKNQKFEELSETELKERIELFGEFLDLGTVHIEQIAPWKDAFWLTVE